MTTTTLVRYSQTERSRVERFRSRAEVPLNEIGLAQAETSGAPPLFTQPALTLDQERRGKCPVFQPGGSKYISYAQKHILVTSITWRGLPGRIGSV